MVCLTPDPLYGVTWHEFGTVEVRCYNIDASTMKTMGSAPITGLSCWTTEPSPLKRTVAIFVRRGILRDAGMKVDAGNGVNFFSYANHPHFSDRPACRGVFPQDARTCGGTPVKVRRLPRRLIDKDFSGHGYSRRRCDLAFKVAGRSSTCPFRRARA